eukprot:COSAG06_NODE_56746_length_283_cov_0.842391_1_plen_52_part_01
MIAHLLTNSRQARQARHGFLGIWSRLAHLTARRESQLQSQYIYIYIYIYIDI